MISKISQFAVVSPNCDATIKAMRDALNIGPLKVWDFEQPEIFETSINGRMVPWTMKLAFGWLGGMQFEVIEPTGGATLYQNYLNRFKRAGVQHLLIDRGKISYEKMKDQLAQAGMPIVNEAKTNVAVKLGPFTLPPLPMFLAKSMSTVFGYASTFDSLKTVIETSKYPPGIAARQGIRMGVPTYWSLGDRMQFEELPEDSLITEIEGFIVLVNDIEQVRLHYTKLFGASSSKLKNELYFTLETNFLKVLQPVNGSAYEAVLKERGEGVQILQATPRYKIKTTNDEAFRQKDFRIIDLDVNLSLFSHPQMPFQIQVSL
jgi:Glyoxalase/Bleomycin resistance protein/Dioxygenase superfamily